MSEVYALLSLLYSLQTIRQKLTFILTIVLLLLAAYLEYKVITLIGPLVGLVSEDGGEAAELALSLILLAVLSAIVRVLQIYVGHRYVYGLGHMLSSATLKNTLHADYLELKLSHSAELLKRFEMINVAVNSVLTPLLILLASGITALAIGISLALTDIQVAIVCLGGLAGFYLLTVLLSRKMLLRNAALFNRTQGERIFLIREAMSGCRELRIGALAPVYQSHFDTVDHDFRNSQVRNLVLGAAPRFVLEGLAFTTVALWIYWISQGGDGSGTELLSILATFALGAQRLLPHAQSIYSSIASIIGHHSLINELKEPLFKEQRQFKKISEAGNQDFPAAIEGIKISNLCFVYPDATRPTFSDVNLELPGGSRVALVGSSGSGKTTFLELLCGLLRPTKGEICIGKVLLYDNNIEVWQRQIAYVPQHPFLVTGSIRENILLGGNDSSLPDTEIIAALNAVGLSEWVRNLADGLNYDVGENGSNLSGGQRQRLAIARALVSKKTILVLDEITSNLDSKNESIILELILSLPREYTIVCSLHKAQILDKFDQIVTFDANGTNQFVMGERA